MPRSPTVLTPPPGTLPFTPNTTIESGKANAVWLDLYQDGNTPRPIEYGGTGANNAQDALNNLGAVGRGNFLSAYSIGDFFETVRNISSVDGVWLRRNGALYSSTTYPELAALLPPLTDSVSWTVTPVGTPSAFNDVAVGNGLVVGVGNGGMIYVSSDYGTSFTPVGSGTTKDLVSVAYGAGSFVAAAADLTRVVSSDGENWSVGSISGPDSFSLTCIRYINGQYLVGGATPLNYTFIGTSTDMVTVSANKVSATDGTGISSFVWTGSYYLASSFGSGSFARAYRSTDAETWTSSTTGVNNVRGMATDGTTVVLVGAGGGLATTTNGTGFTLRTSGTSVQLWAAVHSPDAGWLVVGDGGVARISTNATAWTGTTTGTTAALRAATYNPDNTFRYIVLGANGVSMNGLRTSPTQFQVPNDSPQYGWIKAEND